MRWSIRAALVLMVVVLLVRLGPRRRSGSWARGLWTLGCALFLLHVGWAFHMVHHWSHAAAYRETGRRTAELFGTSSGAGLYFNYAFMIVWVADVCGWWIGGLEAYDRRPRWVDVLVYGFMVFMAVNATVVFEHGVVRWGGAVAMVLLIAAWVNSRLGKAMSNGEQAMTTDK